MSPTPCMKITRLSVLALALVAAATLVIGLSGSSGGTAELVAMVGFFAFVLCLGIAYVVATVLARRP